eukprot:786304-Pyramimonas_sp.AAC.1
MSSVKNWWENRILSDTSHPSSGPDTPLGECWLRCRGVAPFRNHAGKQPRCHRLPSPSPVPFAALVGHNPSPTQDVLRWQRRQHSPRGVPGPEEGWDVSK